ncbi:MAG TPA: hypothetical protein VIU12_02950 [Chryseolinea sp.]
MKIPSFQFYPADWRKDPGVQSLNFHDRGVWFEILCLLHESADRGRLLLNGTPMPDDALSRLLGLDKQVLTKTLTTLLEYGVASRDPDTGALMSRRMVRDENLRKIRQASGKLGGNPALLNQKPNQDGEPPLKQNPTPSSSSSSSSSNTEEDPQADLILPTSKHPKPSKAKGTEDEIKAFAVEIGLPVSDGEYMFQHWESIGWKRGNSPILSWRAAMRAWKKGNYFPSQKDKSNPSAPSFEGDAPRDQYGQRIKIVT